MNISNNCFKFLSNELLFAIGISYGDLDIQKNLVRVDKRFSTLFLSTFAWKLRYAQYGFLGPYCTKGAPEKRWYSEKADLFSLIEKEMHSWSHIKHFSNYLLILKNFSIKIINLSNLTNYFTKNYSSLLISSCCCGNTYAVGGSSMILVGSSQELEPKQWQLPRDKHASIVCFLDEKRLAWKDWKQPTIYIIDSQTGDSLYYFEDQPDRRFCYMDLCDGWLDCVHMNLTRTSWTRCRYSIEIKKDQSSHKLEEEVAISEPSYTWISENRRFVSLTDSICLVRVPSQDTSAYEVLKSYQGETIRKIVPTKKNCFFVLLSTGLIDYLDASGKVLASSRILQQYDENRQLIPVTYKGGFTIDATLIVCVETVDSFLEIPIPTARLEVKSPSRTFSTKFPCSFMWNPEIKRSYFCRSHTRNRKRSLEEIQPPIQREGPAPDNTTLVVRLEEVLSQLKDINLNS